MSWDATIVTTCCGSERGEWGYTYNTTPMTIAAAEAIGVEWKGFQKTLDGMNVRDGSKILALICRELTLNATKYDAMNPENGWGSRQGIVDVMREMFTEGALAPEASVWRVT